MMKEAESEVKKLRKRLLAWHYNKLRALSVFDLMSSDYQAFRYTVSYRVDKALNFREAIKEANEDELYMLMAIRDELRLKI